MILENESIKVAHDFYSRFQSVVSENDRVLSKRSELGSESSDTTQRVNN